MKLEIRGDKVKIIINIQEPMGLPYKDAKLYVYHEAGDHLAAIEVGDIESVDGVLTYQTRTDWQNLFHTERDLYTFDGMAVMYNDSHYYIGDFADKDRRDYELVKRKPKPTIAKMMPVEEFEINEVAFEEVTERAKRDAEDSISDVAHIEKELSIPEEAVSKMMKTDVTKADGLRLDKTGLEEVSRGKEGRLDKGRQEEPGTEKVRIPENEQPTQASQIENRDSQNNAMGRLQQEDIDEFEKIIATYPKLPIYGATELFDCVRIHPRDIGKLDMRNWKLGVNSFLTHGYYTYQYLLLGKLRFEDGSHQGIIGVPGVFTNREKYLANMFGFDQFIPVKQTGIKTGEFGYWIVEISDASRLYR